MRSTFIFISSTAIMALAIAAAVPSSAAELKISGAATVANTIVMPNKAVLERETGLTLAITVNGDGNGLKDLAAGRSDIMMVAAPLKVTEAAVNKIAPGSANADGLEMTQIGTVAIRFILNPANPVKSLTEAQVKDLLEGKTTSWKDVGGPDRPVMVVAEIPGFGTRANIVATLLGGTEITDKARVMQALVQVAQVVGQAPDAIGYGNDASITSAVAVIPGVVVKQPIGFATRGQPGEDAKKLIEAATKFAGAGN